MGWKNFRVTKKVLLKQVLFLWSCFQVILCNCYVEANWALKVSICAISLVAFFPFSGWFITGHFQKLVSASHWLCTTELSIPIWSQITKHIRVQYSLTVKVGSARISSDLTTAGTHPLFNLFFATTSSIEKCGEL